MQLKIDWNNWKLTQLQRELSEREKEIVKLKKRCAAIQGWYTRKKKTP